jgi:hypothetical protein
VLPAILALSIACGRVPVTNAPREWPSGTVLALNGVPITQEDVDEVAGWYAMLEPQFALPHLRRLAVSNVIFPKWAARTAEPDRRSEAQAAARQALDACRAGSPPAEPALRASDGNWREIDLTIWRSALDTEPGAWTDVIESPGCFHVARVEERKSGRTPRETMFVLSVLDFPYLDATKGPVALDEAIDRSHLVFIDPAWHDVVPTLWQHRMRGESP